MAYLVDTHVISEAVKLRPNAGVMDFLRDTHFFLPSLVFAELAYGTYALNPDSKVYTRYVRFIENLKRQYQHIVIPLSLEMAELSGRLRAVESKKGRVLSFADSAIAATAMLTGATLVTRNTKDFAQLNVMLLNPFSSD